MLNNLPPELIYYIFANFLTPFTIDICRNVNRKLRDISLRVYPKNVIDDVLTYYTYDTDKLFHPGSRVPGMISDAFARDNNTGEFIIRYFTDFIRVRQVPMVIVDVLFRNHCRYAICNYANIPPDYTLYDLFDYSSPEIFDIFNKWMLVRPECSLYMPAKLSRYRVILDAILRRIPVFHPHPNKNKMFIENVEMYFVNLNIAIKYFVDNDLGINDLYPSSHDKPKYLIGFRKIMNIIINLRITDNDIIRFLIRTSAY